MQTATWIDRITDESNPWLRAVDSEGRGDMASAALFYLEDGILTLKHGHLAKAALSASCAADCAVRLGLPGYSNLLNREVASLYHENANRVAGTSIREMIWSLRQARQFYILAGEAALAERVHNEYVVAASRVDPLFAGDRDYLEGLVQAPEPQRARVSAKQAAMGEQLAKAVERFLDARGGKGPAVGAKTKPVPVRLPAPRNDERNEKSIVNQLG